MSKKINKNLINKKGFSIGEAILSVFILGVVMTSILALYYKSVAEFHNERDSVIASILAQEGIEVARNIRDNNWAKRSDVADTTPEVFSGFDVSSGSSQNDCRVDANAYSINADNEIVYSSGINCSGASRILNINGGFYSHSVGTATKFRRTITLDNTDSDKMVVSSFVSWNNSDPPTTVGACTVKDKCVFSQATLTDWGTGL